MAAINNSFWDERYSMDEFVYGKEPNDFFKEHINKLKPGKLLLLGEGEGRNAVFAAQLGWQVDAIDYSVKAEEKALYLSKENNVTINYSVKNLAEFIPVTGYYDAAALIFVHLNNDLSQLIHSRTIDSLKTGGKVIVELYSKDQLGKASGGPQDLSVLYSLDDIKNNFSALSVELIEAKDVVISEGKFHTGKASVIRFIGSRQ